MVYWDLLSAREALPADSNGEEKGRVLWADDEGKKKGLLERAAKVVCD